MSTQAEEEHKHFNVFTAVCSIEEKIIYIFTKEINTHTMNFYCHNLFMNIYSQIVLHFLKK